MDNSPPPNNQGRPSTEKETDKKQVASPSPSLESKQKAQGPEQISQVAVKAEGKQEPARPVKDGKPATTRDDTKDVSEPIHELKSQQRKAADEDDEESSSMYSRDSLRRESPIRVRLLSEEDLQRVQKTFVAPDGFAQIEDRFSQHMIVLKGEKYSGKYTTARYLAYQCLKNGLVERVYHVPNDARTNLHSLVKRYPKSLLIIRDALSTDSFIFQSIKGIGGQRVGTAAERKALLDILDKRFNKEELRTLCLELEDVDYDDLGGEGKSGKARELVSYLDRRGRTYELMKIGRRERSNSNWGNSFEIIPQLQRCITPVSRKLRR